MLWHKGIAPALQEPAPKITGILMGGYFQVNDREIVSIRLICLQRTKVVGGSQLHILCHPPYGVITSLFWFCACSRHTALNNT